jgi:serine/threonine protein kinase
VGEGLQYLHQLKIVHGDLKPVSYMNWYLLLPKHFQANILVDHDGVAKLCDFGLVRLIDWGGAKGMTTTSPHTGTALYRAPELVITDNNRHPVATLEGDMYSVGSIMLEVRRQQQRVSA